MLFSIISPVYACDKSLVQLYERIRCVLEPISSDFEILFINDGSPDKSWETISLLSQTDKRVKGINFSRNFGQHKAIAAGLQFAKGEWLVVMDCDLQDQPEEIAKLYKKAREGYDMVLAQRIDRQDSALKKAFSQLFYNILGYLTDTKQDFSIANFGIYRKEVIQSINEMGDAIRYFPTMAKWVGYNSTVLKVEHAARSIGKTSYSFKKMLKLAIDVMLAFSDKPLRLTAKLGLLVSLLSILFAIYNLFLYFQGDITQTGWASIIISIWFLSGLIIFVLGIVGIYIGKIYEKVKERPLYIIRDKVNL